MDTTRSNLGGEHYLETPDGHTLHYRVVGHPDGAPVLFLHGGPGSGCPDRVDHLIDYRRAKVVLLDQRGCGRSLPHASLSNNTTEHLIDDILLLGEHLQIKQWVIVGGSWGTTLALAFAAKYPSHVLGMSLRGVFLSREMELDWLLGGGLGEKFFPLQWARFLSLLRRGEKHDAMAGYLRLVTDPDVAVAQQAANEWCNWESCVATIGGRTPDALGRGEFMELDGPQCLAWGRIGAWYLHHRCWIDADAMLGTLSKVVDFPISIVHGRFDMVCPPRSAYDVYDAVSTANVYIVEDGGHSAAETKMRTAVWQTNDRLLSSLGWAA